jgi:2-polyprenyl-3-methyl-5-hydroxy-6-metoxy-1,4-benzoquinol methylase
VTGRGAPAQMSAAEPSAWHRPVTSRLRARRALWSIYEDIGRVLGEAALHEGNLVPRACPVCGADDPDRRPVLMGPVYAFHRCRCCAMLYAPRVLRPELVAERYRQGPLRRAYWVHMRDDARAAAAGDVHGPLVARLLPHVTRRGVALDVGAGFGGLVAALARSFDEALGLELDVATAVDGSRLHGVRIEPVRIEELDRAPGSIDLVTLNQVLEHLEEPGPILAAASRLLAPGGILWISVPHGASVGLELLAGRHPHVATHMHVNLFERASLRTLAERHGFQTIETGCDDDPALSVLDLARADAPPLLAAPALAVDKGLRWLATRSRLPSRLGRGAHIEIIARKP